MGRRKKSSVSFAPDSLESQSLDAAFPPLETDTRAAWIAGENPTLDATLEDAKKKKELQQAVDKIPEIFTPDQVAWIFDVYVALLSFIYSLMLDTDFKAISAELSFEQEEKMLMAKPLARVCSKYAPSEWAGMQPEIELITVMGIWTVTSYKRAQKTAEKVKEEKAKAERAKVVRQNSPAAQPIRDAVGVTA